jgi:hypothetical protein
MARATRQTIVHEEQLLLIIGKLKAVSREIESFDASKRVELRQGANDAQVWYKNRLAELLEGCSDIEKFIADINPASVEEVKLTLSRSMELAKFFALKFIQQPRTKLSELESRPFYGSGVYALYYVGELVPAYSVIAKTETPVYIGKADPEVPFADTTREQGQELWKRLREHAKSIGKATSTLKEADFEYRYGTIQSGMQTAVEDFLIRFFSPIWNDQTKICYGIGKHGDSSSTRRNKRSPWDTMHPGRPWADSAHADQIAKPDIEALIATHLRAHPPYADLSSLIAKLLKA